jgi:mRNA interferase MazF
VVAPRRGEVWWARLAPPRGSEPGYARPVLVVQSNAFNDSRIQTVIVAAIGSNLRLADAPGNLRLRRSESGLPKDSVVNVSQLLTVGREYLGEKAGVVSAGTMNRVAEGLRLVLAL